MNFRISPVEFRMFISVSFFPHSPQLLLCSNKNKSICSVILLSFLFCILCTKPDYHTFVFQPRACSSSCSLELADETGVIHSQMNSFMTGMSLNMTAGDEISRSKE